ncbi:MAG: hypothetical protein M5R36_02295 [Deltaproteobacteria bacterium]|nr:hypothetical protein [Deltaproteobacteria bacterium]
MKIKALFVATLLIVALASSAGAQDLLDKNIHYFHPTVDGSGLIVSYGSEPLGMFRMYYGVFADDALNTLDYEPPPDRDTEKALLTNQLALTGVFGVGLWEYVNVGVAVPFIATRAFDADFGEVYPHPRADEFDADDPNRPKGQVIDGDTDSSALEDLRFDVKLIGINRLARCLGVGAVTTVGFPVLYKENNFVSDGGVTVAPRLVLDLGREWWTIVFNGGYKYYSRKSRAALPGLSAEISSSSPGDYNIEDEIIFGGGAKFRFSYGSELVLDSKVLTFANDFMGDSREDYAEVMAAYRKYFRGLNFTAMTLGVGAGVLDGVGSPTLRVFFGLARDLKQFHIMTY